MVQITLQYSCHPSKMLIFMVEGKIVNIILVKIPKLIFSMPFSVQACNREETAQIFPQSQGNTFSCKAPLADYSKL
ncbi:hypothetical protein BLOT_013753 [Blomia tropicalis]|nr:hypothetical protein BLOT_013753 [Blomia tropicalis]